MVQSSPKLDFRSVFFKEFFKRVVASVFYVFCVFFGALRGYFLMIFSKKCGLISKSADLGFLHTVQRFGLISKVFGALKHEKTAKKVSWKSWFFEGVEKCS